MSSFVGSAKQFSQSIELKICEISPQNRYFQLFFDNEVIPFKTSHQNELKG